MPSTPRQFRSAPRLSIQGGKTVGELTALLLALLLVVAAISVPLIFYLNAERLAAYIQKRRAQKKS